MPHPPVPSRSAACSFTHHHVIVLLPRAFIQNPRTTLLSKQYTNIPHQHKTICQNVPPRFSISALPLCQSLISHSAVAHASIRRPLPHAYLCASSLSYTLCTCTRPPLLHIYYIPLLRFCPAHTLFPTLIACTHNQWSNICPTRLDHVSIKCLAHRLY